MDNVHSWLYFPPEYQCASKNKDCLEYFKFCSESCSAYKKKQISQIRVKSPAGKTFTLQDILKNLQILEFGNKKQIQLLEVSDFINSAIDEGLTKPTEFYIN
tara:strand:- start:1708 stop:2013 length:306 start_codon:yes stop_codon:yes gene_type:complete